MFTKRSPLSRAASLISTVIALTCMVILFAVTPARADTWHLRTVDSTSVVGQYSSLALDSEGNPHICYWDASNDDLKYTWSDDGGDTWPAGNIRTVDSAGDVGEFCSLALDTGGDPHIGYRDSSGKLKYARSDDGGDTWPAGNIKTVDSTGSVGVECSLALDPDGNPHISYRELLAGGHFNLKYARSDDGGDTWPSESIKTVDSTGYAGDHTSIAVDSGGNPHISYNDVAGQDLKYARSDDGGDTWPSGNIKTIDSTGSVGQYTSLALDSSGNPCISYTGVGGVNYARSDDGGDTWPAGNIVTVDSFTPLDTSLALDSDGNPRISYPIWTPGTIYIKFARSGDGGATWPAGNIVTVDSFTGFSNMATSLALDTGGNPGFSYFHRSDNLKYAFLVARPTVTTQVANSVTAAGATLHGNVTNDGGEKADRRGFRYREKGSSTWVDLADTGAPPFDGGAYSLYVTGLDPCTTYEFYARAHNSAGWGAGDALEFTTPGEGLSTWYLAEGTSAWGFNTYITIENPNDTAVTAKLTYMDPNPVPGGKGIIGSRTAALPPLSQTTVSPAPDIGEVDFSTTVECLEGKKIAVDRTMFWTGEGAATPGYHSSVGASAPSGTWYLPEGSTNWGFETWTLVLNPNATEANVTLTYMTENDGAKSVSRKVPANSRATYSMLSDAGAHDASIKVESDMPVVAERSMYRGARREGSCSVGATTPANDWFLAEGATGYDTGFITYILVQNPNDETCDVALTYHTAKGRVDGPRFTMPANSRKTVRVNDALPADVDFSTSVHGSRPVIAERAMYWDNGTGEAFHDSIGMSEPHATFYLPDGETSDSCETWTLVQNPNLTDISVDITYMTPSGKGKVTKTETVKGNSRQTFNMAEHSGISGRASIMVTSKSSGKKIMVERAVYWNSRGAGTDTIGGYSD